MKPACLPTWNIAWEAYIYCYLSWLLSLPLSHSFQNTVTHFTSSAYRFVSKKRKLNSLLLVTITWLEVIHKMTLHSVETHSGRTSGDRHSMKPVKFLLNTGWRTFTMKVGILEQLPKEAIKSQLWTDVRPSWTWSWEICFTCVCFENGAGLETPCGPFQPTSSVIQWCLISDLDFTY